MVNAGWVKRRGSLPSSILRVKGDLEKVICLKCPAHRIISQAFGRWVSISMLMVIFLIIQKRLTGRSPWSLSITIILFIVRREVRDGGRSPSTLVAQLPLQMFDLLLHGFGIFLVREVATTPRMASTSVGSMHTPLPIPSSLKIDKMIFTLGPPRLYLMWIWTYHSWKSNSQSHQKFPQTAPIVRTGFESLAQNNGWT